MSAIKNYIAISLIVACLALAACAGPSAVEDDYGNSVRNMVNAQAANPNAAADNQGRIADQGDGQRGEGVIEEYREITTESEEVSRDLIIQMGGGGR